MLRMAEHIVHGVLEFDTDVSGLVRNSLHGDVW